MLKTMKWYAAYEIYDVVRILIMTPGISVFVCVWMWAMGCYTVTHLVTQIAPAPHIGTVCIECVAK